MPVMDGFTAAETIRTTDNPNRATPMLALTANVMDCVYQARSDARTHTRTHTHTHTYTHTYARAHTHTHAHIPALSPL